MTGIFTAEAGHRVGAVVIGRNEGERLKTSLRSLHGVDAIVYVDSGSIDGSQAFARSIGVQVVDLAVPPNFTAARARNAGVAALVAACPNLAFVQFVDGDCEVKPGWIAAGLTALESEEQLAAVFGRLRERDTARSIYNALCDHEWNVPVGEVSQCGGNVMMRLSAFAAAGGFEESMIAGEEPDLSARLRKQGWRLRRIEADMALHDAAITRFSQWWKRTRRSGHAYAELAHRHPANNRPEWRRSCRRILLWGGILPATLIASLLAGLFVNPAWLLASAAVLALTIVNILRLRGQERRRGLPPRLATISGALLVIGKVPQFLGLIAFHRNRLSGRRSQLIEYKGTAAA
jgi:GT2 family glycosyltransferase